jgi:pimeloyl-ACP methyl ester carboxylesterase
MADQMLAAIPGATLVTMLGVYHHLVLDAPEAFARILDDFLRGQMQEPVARSGQGLRL